VRKNLRCVSDRFDGCDLSRAFCAAPLADAVMMVIFAVSGKGRFRSRISRANQASALALNPSPA
jgi:hypothetical protein